MIEPTLNEIAKRSHETSKAKGWWDGRLDPADRSFIPEKLMLIVSEASEALESYRKHDPLVFYKCPTFGHKTEQTRCSCSGCVFRPGDPPPLTKPEGIASELADLVIRVGDLAERLGIDLGRAVEEKHAYNMTRSQRHGGKAC